jgi:hypothetical protein
MPKPSERWCLLIHSLPTRPLYLRARIRRLLEDAGAAPLRKAVYTLPASPEALERLRVIAREIEAAAGTAIVCEASFPDAATAEWVVRSYNDELARRYRLWSDDVKRALARPPARGRKRMAAPTATGVDGGRRLERLRQRLELLKGHDRFAAPGGASAQALLERVDRLSARGGRASGWVGRRWVTRRGLHVDRLACAWVVRRFIDPRATFRFAANPAAPLAANEIGFDMPGAEIGHENGGCSMESLIERAGISDPRVRYVADIVHDIDLGDGRHGRPETAGFAQLLVGLVASTPADEDRVERGLLLFDAFYAAPARGSASPVRATPRVEVPAALRRVKRR